MLRPNRSEDATNSNLEPINLRLRFNIVFVYVFLEALLAVHLGVMSTEFDQILV